MRYRRNPTNEPIWLVARDEYRIVLTGIRIADGMDRGPRRHPDCVLLL